VRSADARAGALGFALVTVSGADDGGYFERTWGWLTLGLLAVVVLALLLGGPQAPGRLGLVAVVALAGLAVWTLLWAAWGIDGTGGWSEARRTFLYLVALVALLVVVEFRSTAALLIGVLAGITALVSYGLVEWLVSNEPDPFQGRLLREPIGYANALGILAATGLLLAVGLGLRGGRSRVLLLPGVVLAVGLVLTESRGAWLAFVAGLAVLLVLRSARPQLWGAVAGVALIGVLVVAIASPLSLGDRSKYWDAALDDARERPLTGSGAGSFEEYWRAHGDPAIHVRDAHSLYLEAFAELGVVGLALVLVVLCVPFLALRERRGDVEVAAAASLAAFVVHAGLDWDWELPVLVLTGLSCAAALLVAARAASPP
jgi:hypothetical protein